jgi:hypothetical protein
MSYDMSPSLKNSLEFVDNAGALEYLSQLDLQCQQTEEQLRALYAQKSAYLQRLGAHALHDSPPQIDYAAA